MYERVGPLVLSLAFVVLTAAATGCDQPRDSAGSVASGENYRASIDAWRQQRLAELTDDDGWLTLIGLHWLDEPGVTVLGSDPQSDVVLPPTLPVRVGVVRFERSTEGADGGAAASVRLELEPGVAGTAGGVPFSAGELRSDRSDSPTVVQVGTVTVQAIDRNGRLGLRLKDTANPARSSFPGVESYPVDPTWRLQAVLEPYEPPHEMDVADVTGGIQHQVVPGALRFEVDGQELRLDAFDNGDDLMIVFADQTSGDETYGAGRYLHAPKPDANGLVELDFNRAYNPPCAFTEFATCPLPPRQNRLPVRVLAGERFSGHA